MFGLFGPAAFSPDRDIPSLKGKVILVTGANTGIGKETVRYLAAHDPSRIYLAARNKAKADEAISDIEASVPGSKIHFLELDLSSLASVDSAASKFLAENDRLDILINNAGIMAHPPGLSKDGYETQFGTNHMGHFLFTRRLLPLLEKTAASGADVRILNLTSAGHVLAPPGGWLPELCTVDMAEWNTWRRYGQSKLANILFTVELARRYPQLTSVAIHPGSVATNLTGEFERAHPWFNALAGWVLPMFGKTPAQGAWNQTWASVVPLEKNQKGGLRQAEYYTPVAVVGTKSVYAKDEGLARRLWDWSVDEIEKKGY